MIRRSFVVQHVLEHGGLCWRSRTIQKLTPSLPSLAMHRFGSRVVQQAITHGSEDDCRGFVATLIAAEGQYSLKQLATNHYSNFVLEQLLHAHHGEASELQERLLSILPQLTASEFGFRVAKHFDSGAVPGLVQTDDEFSD